MRRNQRVEKGTNDLNDDLKDIQEDFEIALQQMEIPDLSTHDFKEALIQKDIADIRQKRGVAADNSYNQDTILLDLRFT